MGKVGDKISNDSFVDIVWNDFAYESSGITRQTRQMNGKLITKLSSLFAKRLFNIEVNREGGFISRKFTNLLLTFSNHEP